MFKMLLKNLSNICKFIKSGLVPSTVRVTVYSRSSGHSDDNYHKVNTNLGTFVCDVELLRSLELSRTYNLTVCGLAIPSEDIHPFIYKAEKISDW